MPTTLVFCLGAILGVLFGFLLAALLPMASRRARDPEALGSTGLQPVDLKPVHHLQLVPEGLTWCQQCQAMFKGSLCPGCSPDWLPETGYHPGSLADPRD